MDISLIFDDPISEAYEKKLQTLLDNFLAEGVTENRPPSFEFNGSLYKTIFAIANLQLAYDRRQRA